MTPATIPLFCWLLQNPRSTIAGCIRRSNVARPFRTRAHYGVSEYEYEHEHEHGLTMDMFGVGWVEMALIGIVALLVYGRDLPDAMRKAGQVMGDLRKNLDKVKEEIQRELPKRADLPKVGPLLEDEAVGRTPESHGGEFANVPEPVKDVEAPLIAPPVGASESRSVGESGGTTAGADVGKAERPSVEGSDAPAPPPPAPNGGGDPAGTRS